MLYLFCLFDLILYTLSTIFQLFRDESSWVEPALKLGIICFAQGHNTVTPVRLKPKMLYHTILLLTLCPLEKVSSSDFFKIDFLE